MKVCFVTTAFPRWAGDGQAAFVGEVVRAVARQNIQVRVVAMHSPGLPTREYMEGIEVLRPRYWVPERWEILRKEGAAGLPATWRKYPLARLQVLPFSLVHTLAAARFARSFDLIHAEWTLSAGAAAVSRPAHGCPILVTVQGSDIFQFAKQPIGASFTRSVLGRCDAITALSHALKDATVSVGVQARKIHIVPNGVDTNRFVPVEAGSRENLILYVGTFIERKGLCYLLEAMPEVLRIFPNYRLLLIGEGPQEPRLRQLAESLGISERVTFFGFKPQAEIQKWMQRAKVLILPSLEEGMGVVLLEALASGTPVIASQIDGIRDVVTPGVGRLVPPANSEALSATVCSILDSPSRWQELSGAARERAVAHYDWDLVARKYTTLYHSLVQRSE